MHALSEMDCLSGAMQIVGGKDDLGGTFSL
jgi:hypothetical protein